MQQHMINLLMLFKELDLELGRPLPMVECTRDSELEISRLLSRMATTSKLSVHWNIPLQTHHRLDAWFRSVPMKVADG
jgi:hypothetical protein